MSGHGTRSWQNHLYLDLLGALGDTRFLNMMHPAGSTDGVGTVSFTYDVTPLMVCGLVGVTPLMVCGMVVPFVV